jgi:hypothetical protein
VFAPALCSVIIHSPQLDVPEKERFQVAGSLGVCCPQNAPEERFFPEFGAGYSKYLGYAHR